MIWVAVGWPKIGITSLETTLRVFLAPSARVPKRELMSHTAALKQHSSTCYMGSDHLA